MSTQATRATFSFTSTQTALPKTQNRPTLATSYTSASVNATSSSSRSHATDPGLFPPANTDSQQPDETTERNNNVFNYYFLILAVFGVFVAVGLWWIRRRSKRRKEQMRLSGQNALARDLDGWINTRRWMHGAWRHNQPTGFVRREEGLNEHGEAPPPYQPKSEVASEPNGTLQDAASGLTIPLRTLSRDRIDVAQPPQYAEQDGYDENPNVRPDTATTGVTRPDTTDVRPASSRPLLRQGPLQPTG